MKNITGARRIVISAVVLAVASFVAVMMFASRSTSADMAGMAGMDHGSRDAHATSSSPAASGGMEGMDMPGMDMSSHHLLMPGMLTATQMDALRRANGAEFDRLFLTGMIQHHGGALIMVKDLFDTAGAGQDAELFNFATDVDSGQRAEIRIMENMLSGKP